MPRVEDAELLTGRTEFIDNVALPGMLHCAILRSPHPHARIIGIDTSKAEKLPGVNAVIHYRNAEVPWSSGGTTHQRFIFNNPVRYVGDAVAAVAATDRHVAEDALELIEVKYEKLPHVLDAKEALKPDAPKIMPQGNLSVGKGAFSRPSKNLGAMWSKALLKEGSYTVQAKLIYDLNRYNEQSFMEDQTETNRASLLVKVK